MKTLIKTVSLIVFVMLCSCRVNHRADTHPDPTMNQIDSSGMIRPEYAKGFDVTYSDDIILLDIRDPENQNREEFKFALVNKEHNGVIPQGYTRVEIPVETAICMTSLQLSNFLKLGIPEKVAGITSTRHLHNKTMKQQLKDGLTHKIGIEGNFDNEVIMALNPDIILISPFKRGGYDAIRNVDTPLIPHLGYKELTPLGQAEWIKVVGLLTGESLRANEEFKGIESRYNALKESVDTLSSRPSVFSGEMRGGNWYAVGGRSFLAQLFRDAGADYFLKNNSESGGVTLDYETVYSNAAHSDYWRIVNSYEGSYGYDVLKAQDERYTDFDAWKKKGVIYCNMKEVPFYESMPVEPEVVLADFIYVFHPEILPDHHPVYYHLLK